MNQFFYKKTLKAAPPKEGEDPKPDILKWDSFNLDKVIRSVWVDEKVFLVLLDDGHEDGRIEKQPKFNTKGVVVGVENVKLPRQWLQSEIYLDEEDAERFRKCSEIIIYSQVEKNTNSYTKDYGEEIN